jgi:hypothetical protein
MAATVTDQGRRQDTLDGSDVLALWAERISSRRPSGSGRGGLRFAFYGRVSTGDWQDPVTSRARQREQAAVLVAGHGKIVAEFFDAGQSRTLPWTRRPQAAALIAALADPDRGWDAIVIGEYERAFYGSQSPRSRRCWSITASRCGRRRWAGGSTTTPRTMSRPCSRWACSPSGRSPKLRTAGIVLTYDPDTQTIRTGDSPPIAVTTASSH